MRSKTELIKNKIKSLTIEQGLSLRDLAKLLSEKYGRPKYGISNLSHKLIKGSLRYEDALDIAEVLGYDIQWVKKKEETDS